MARLPIPQSDEGNWGDILNEFLEVEHNLDGTLKTSGSLAGKANTTHTHTVSDITNLQGVLDDKTNIDDPPLVKVGGRLVSFGTSRSVGGLPRVLITGPHSLSERFPSKLAAMLGLVEVMHATSGAVLSHDETTPTGGGGGWATLFHHTRRLKPNQHQQGGGSAGSMNLSHPDAVVTIADWINDQALVNAVSTGNYTGNRQASRTQNIITMTMRTLISLAQAARIWEPNNTGSGELVYGGTSSSQVNASYISGARNRPWRGAVSGPGGYRSMSNGAWVEIPLPADYPGSATAPVSVIFSGVASTSSGSIVSSGTDIPAKTLILDGGSWADPDATNPLIMRFSGNDLSSGAKTIRLTVTGLSGANARFQRCWIEANSAPQVLCFETVISNPVGYLFPQSSVSDFNLYNNILQSVVAEFRSNVKFVQIPLLDGDGNGNSDASRNPYFTDTMHHTEIGHAEYALAGYRAITGLAETSELRNWARYARATVQDFRCECTLSTNLSLTNNTPTAIPWDIELVDRGGLHDDMTDLERLVAPTDGLWRCEFQGGMDSGAAGTGVRLLYIRLIRTDGSQDQCVATNLVTTGTNAFFQPSGQVAWEVEMRSGDYLECIVIQTSGTTRTFVSSSPTPRVSFRKVADL